MQRRGFRFKAVVPVSHGRLLGGGTRRMVEECFEGMFFSSPVSGEFVHGAWVCVCVWCCGEPKYLEGQSMARTDSPGRLYWFNWPSHVGGADTKFVHLLPLLAGEYEITVVPNDPKSMESEEWRNYLERTGAAACLMADL